jgi:hypothetical protein
MSGRERHWLTRVLLVAGGILGALSLVAGHLHRNLLDGPTFAANVDELRRDDVVAARIGESITEQLVLAHPDLVALAPLVQSVATEVARGELLAGPTRRAASATHRLLTEPDADSVVLRITDAAAVVTGMLGVVAPERMPAATDVSVTLASIGDQAFASTTLAVARLLGVLAWLLPVLTLACLAAAVLGSRDRWRASAQAGGALVAAAGAVGGLLVVGGFLVRRVDDHTLGGAVARAAWQVFVRPLWWSVVVVAGVGAAIMITVGSAAPAALASVVSRVSSALRQRPTTTGGVAVRAALALAVGVAAIADPTGLAELAVLLAGTVLVLFALSEVSTLAAPARARAAAEAPSGEPGGTARALAVVTAAVGGLVLLTGAAWLARPGGDAPASAEAVTGDGEICNGHAELCERPFDEVAYAASHNAMTAAREPGWFLAEQIDPIRVQLDQGVRALLIDVWSGRSAGTVVRTAASSYAEALAVAEAELGPEVVAAAQRVAASVAGVAEGPEARYLCHGLCETGSTPFLEMLADLRSWLAANPDEVVTLFIEDHVEAALIAADIEAAGLLPYVHTPVVGAPWPTLGEMIRSGRRLVVMVESGSGGVEAPWLVNGFEHTQETPYTFPTVDDFSCAPNRGPADAPLFQLNHWIADFTRLVSSAQLVNTREVLLARAEQCWAERGQIPNFIAVNYVTIGDLFDVVDELNGVG